MTMPKQKPGRSRQDYETPDDFFQAVQHRFGMMVFDLAASMDNSKCGSFFYNEQDDSLTHVWHGKGGNVWLNPPYGDIGPWAEKCAIESAAGAKIFMLVPASIGSNWYMDFVEPYAYVLAPSPRLSFDGKHPYPKDVILACYLHGLTGFKTWRWK